jgi:catechol 2,3-dioxygenase-like lactoylglutathione lyase family enzyme
LQEEKKMAVVGLDHYALLCSDPERTAKFYEQIVGLKVGPRPELSFPGLWLYAGDAPIVHIIFGKTVPTKETGAVDHLAFTANGRVEDIHQRLTQNNIEFTSRVIERSGVTQVFFRDPDNVGIELNFAPS